MAQTGSPFIEFSREQWRQYRADERLSLTEAEIQALCGHNQTITIDEAEDIYLPLCRLLNMYVTQRQSLHALTNQFLFRSTQKVPFIIGVCGSVAVGKSTTSRLIQRLLTRWDNHPKVDIVTTDGFLYPNAVLNERGLMERKGYPESYQVTALIDFLTRVKSGEKHLTVPLYSHAIYDVTNQTQTISQPDILIIEGLNILQPALAGKQHGYAVSDFIDFSIYVDAPTPVIEQWYIDRFQSFRREAATQPDRFFYQFSKMSDEEANAYGKLVWKTVNEPNLLLNILPVKPRAHLILEKNPDHRIKTVYLRKV